MNRSICAVFGMLLLTCRLAPLAHAQQQSASEWRQARADSAHSSYLPTAIHPPLAVAWRIPIHGYGGIEGSGNTIYLTDSGYAMGLPEKVPSWPIVEALNAEDGTVKWGVNSESHPPESALERI